jgi:type IV pilus assembly protein PilQ
LTTGPIYSQARFDSIQAKLTELAGEYPGLNQKVELSVTDVSLLDFLNALAVSNKLNVSVDETLTTAVNNNFTNVTVSDVLLFLGKKYDLDITFIGSIINIKKFKEPVPPPVKAEPKNIQLKYNKEKDLINLDLKNDTLYQVAKELTKVTGYNVIVAKDAENKLVSGFIQDQNFSGAIDMLTYTNNLKVRLTDAGFYLIESNAPVNSIDAKSGQSNSGNINKKKGEPDYLWRMA